MKPLHRVLSVLIAALLVTSCATFEGPDGEVAPFAQLGPCRALGQWLEPLERRHGEQRLGGWNEVTTRERTKFLFTDPYFVPIFGTPVDALDGRQVAAIRKALMEARSACTDEPFLQSMYPDIFLARAFDPRLPLTPLSRSFVVAHAIEQRTTAAGSDRVPDSAARRQIRRVQQQLNAQGFDAGPADGLSGARTARAVAAYKRAHELLPMTGEITPELVARLDAGAPVPARSSANAERAATDRERGAGAAMLETTRGTEIDSASRASAPSERIEGTPEAFVVDIARLLAGETIRLTETNMPFLGGVSVGVIQACEVPRAFGDRAELTKFAMSVGVVSAGGNRYSDENIGRSVESGLRSQALFSTGEKAGGNVPCARAERVTAAILRSLRADAQGDDGGPSTFVGSCVDAFDEGRCRCLADAGRTVMPDIHRQRYERSVIPTIISRNPLVGMQIIASCGIVNY